MQRWPFLCAAYCAVFGVTQEYWIQPRILNIERIQFVNELLIHLKRVAKIKKVCIFVLSNSGAITRR